MNWYRFFPLTAATALAVIAALSTAAWVLASSPFQSPTPVHTVTRADDGKTAVLEVGDRFLLELGEEFNWTVTVTDQSVVKQVPGILVVRGAQGVYEAERTGETELAAVGTLNCPPQQPCPLVAVLFRITFIVYAGSNHRLFVPQVAADSARRSQFAVRVTVVAGPTCPVERVPPDPGCADRPVPGAEIIFLNSTGEVVADARSDVGGRFSVSLAPGTYTLKPQPVAGLLGTAPKKAIAIDSADLDVTLRYDTGIR
ncbi:MAG: carboxypeptidase-like regulatory domain-containing protein [Anaerolineaceae bacterium]